MISLIGYLDLRPEKFMDISCFRFCFVFVRNSNYLVEWEHILDKFEQILVKFYRKVLIILNGLVQHVIIIEGVAFFHAKKIEQKP